MQEWGCISTASFCLDVCWILFYMFYCIEERLRRVYLTVFCMVYSSRINDQGMLLTFYILNLTYLKLLACPQMFLDHGKQDFNELCSDSYRDSHMPRKYPCHDCSFSMSAHDSANQNVDYQPFYNGLLHRTYALFTGWHCQQLHI